MPAIVEMHPQTINKKARGPYVDVLIEFADGPSVFDVDTSTVTLQAISPVTSAQLNTAPGSPTEIGDQNGNGLLDLMVKFDRATVQSWFPEDTLATFRVRGRLVDGREFQGDTSARIINAGVEHTNEATPGSVQQ